jgi:hypothetical protein
MGRMAHDSREATRETSKRVGGLCLAAVWLASGPPALKGKCPLASRPGPKSLFIYRSLTRGLHGRSPCESRCFFRRARTRRNGPPAMPGGEPNAAISPLLSGSVVACCLGDDRDSIDDHRHVQWARDLALVLSSGRDSGGGPASDSRATEGGAIGARRRPLRTPRNARFAGNTLKGRAGALSGAQRRLIRLFAQPRLRVRKGAGWGLRSFAPRRLRTRRSTRRGSMDGALRSSIGARKVAD